jgi:lysophospholipase L1-like esterase
MAIGGVILCVGDSLTYGARDDYGLSYPELLARRMSEEFKQHWTAVNHGISGQVSAEILRRCYTHVHEFTEASEVFLWAGFNDAKVNVMTPPDVYQANMESMIRSILFAGRACYLFDIPPMAGFGAPDFVSNDRIGKYNERIEEIWEKHRLQGSRLYPVEVSGIPAKYRNDGVHLSHAGNQWVAEQALRAVKAARAR